MSQKSRRIVRSRAEGHVVLGRRLWVLCADNLELLDARGCGLVEGNVPSPVELIDAIAILGQDPASAAADLENDCLWRCFGGWVDKHIFRSTFARRRIEAILRGGEAYKNELEALSAWLDDNWKPPKLRWKRGADKKAAAPYTDHLRVKLCESGLCKDSAEAGRYPLSDALWEAEALFEQETGESRLESDDDRDADAAIDESIRLYKEEQKSAAKKAGKKSVKKKTPKKPKKKGGA